MARVLEPDLCIVGAGAAGLSLAAGAARLGARVVLIERGVMGGECLNVGCVPSKSLLAAAHAAHAMRSVGRFGIAPVEPEVDFAGVMAHVRSVIAGIAPHDGQVRFEGLGVTVLREEARFTGPDELVAGDARVRPRRFALATGSAPAVPPVPGLESVAYLTNETVFDLTERPAHLLVLGGGPIGVELAQGFRRLGSRVTLTQRGAILPKDDPEAVAVVRAALVAEGVDLREGAGVTRAAPGGEGVALTLQGGAEVSGTHLLVAAGRRAVHEALDLPAAGIEIGENGIAVDARLRTSNPRVFAFGDATGGLRFTHVAGYEAGIVLRNALARWPAEARGRTIPWVTFTDPELAQAGLTEADARAGNGEVRTIVVPFAELDRARTERASEGFLKLVLDGAKPLGVTIVGRGAGELILPWVLAMDEGLSLSAMAGIIAPYPTLGEASKRAAGEYYAPKVFSPLAKWVIRKVQDWT